MHKEFIMGNAAIAKGALAAGLNVISGYPGTPSSEVLETAAKTDKDIYVEWSANEKAALELAAGASYCGARSMVTMKQVGLNVASDPLMSLAYVGVKGGMIIMVADDPGPISSQTEQDTRTFAAFSKLPCFDPSSVEEAFSMVADAFELSEKYHTPVIFRPTTRVCHGYASIDIPDKEEWFVNKPTGFERDPSRWVIFPRLSYKAHTEIEKRNRMLSQEGYKGNCVLKGSRKGIASHGISAAYVHEVLEGLDDKPSFFKVSMPFPFPEKTALEFLSCVDEVLCIEELDPVIESELTYVCGKYHIDVKIRGKLTDDIHPAGENDPTYVRDAVQGFVSGVCPEREETVTPKLPARPPVLCAGCPHRASFYAVKMAMRNMKAVFCGDIGCYTLGNAQPLDMVDTCLCMGAGVNIAQGIGKIEPDTYCFAFVGDSTFFASAVTGVINGVYNQANMTLVVLDNSTTAMTGHQPHPGTGRTMMGDIVDKIDIEAVLHGVGVETVVTVDPFDLENAVNTVRCVAALEGVKAIIFKSPCAVIIKQGKPCTIDKDKCTECKACIKRIGCPALVISDGKVTVERSLCTGCGLCTQVCPVNAIERGAQV
ncbi:MAG: indolepyruvate ferredoxin oxidoreductase subunit alpha [Oscillospiraceae bacterium]|nr:indolepyruvate ferredoxin oxidoreductase subunit alpha [Oscillospiraceae bacterium]